MDLTGDDATTCKQWTFILKAPPVEKFPKHIYCAVVLIDHALVTAKVLIISPLVGVSHIVATHCKENVGNRIRRSYPGLEDDIIEYQYYPVKTCATRASVYTELSGSRGPTSSAMVL